MYGGERGVTVKTIYDSDRDMFITRGRVTLNVSIQTLAEMASKFSEYERWALKNINVKSNGKSFIVQLKYEAYAWSSVWAWSLCNWV